MTHLVRIVLAIATAQGGVVLIDENENGLHHSILPTVWGVIGEAAERLDVQVFATTHIFECVEAAHHALGPDGFRLHRLEVVDNQSRCVTLSPTAIDGVIRHNLEVRLNIAPTETTRPFQLLVEGNDERTSSRRSSNTCDFWTLFRSRFFTGQDRLRDSLEGTRGSYRFSGREEHRHRTS